MPENSENTTILLVDDEEAFLETLVKRLKRRELHARTATSGQAALEALAESPADVVIMDVRMPGMDGIEALKRIKAAHPLTEVIMLTGHASLEAAIQGMELGAFDYLMKPVEFSDLVYKIQDACKKKRLAEAKSPTGACGAGSPS